MCTHIRHVCQDDATGRDGDRMHNNVRLALVNAIDLSDQHCRYRYRDSRRSCADSIQLPNFDLLFIFPNHIPGQDNHFSMNISLSHYFGISNSISGLPLNSYFKILDHSKLCQTTVDLLHSHQRRY